MPYRHDDARERARSELAAELARARERPTSERRRDEEREILARIAALGLPRSRRGLPSLPRLPRLRIASPCGESWDAMVGDERVRHCSRCARDVFDLSAMTADEAESLLRAHDALPDGGLPCVRFYRRADGTILTADCVAGTGKKRALQAALAAVTLTTATATAAVLIPAEPPAHRTHFDAPQVRVDLPPTAEQLAIAAQLDADFDRLTACMGSCYTLEDARTFQEGLRGGGRSEVTLEAVMGRVGAEADEEAE